MKKILSFMLFVSISFLIFSCENKNQFNDSTIIWKANIPVECNMSLAMVKMFVELNKGTAQKDFTFINEASKPCWKALDNLRCSFEAYGADEKTGKINPVNVMDGIRYQAYLQCIGRK